MSELDVFHQELFQDIHREAHAEGEYAEDAFFDQFCEHLIEAGELDTADRAHYVSPRGLRIDGYGGDPSLAEGVLSLIVADWRDREVRTLTATDMDISSEGPAFLKSARSVLEGLEETSPAFGLADLIASSG